LTAKKKPTTTVYTGQLTFGVCEGTEGTKKVK